MVSYAQNPRDVLWIAPFPGARRLRQRMSGAKTSLAPESSPSISNELGWHGINVEPATHPFGLLAAEAGAGRRQPHSPSPPRGGVTLYGGPPEPNCPEVDAVRRPKPPAIGSGHNAVEHNRPPADPARSESATRRHDRLLSVDVEGHEREVLAGVGMDDLAAGIVVVAAKEPTTTIRAPRPPRARPTSAGRHLLAPATYALATG